MAKARAGEKVLILDRGNLELSYPSDWTFKPDPAGHVGLSDPTDSYRIEVSYLRLPAPAKALPSPLEQVAELIAGIREAKGAPARAIDRGDLRFAWAEWGYEADDTDRGERRGARQRILVASNGRFQALLTFTCWEDDAPRAVPAFERVLATLHLGDGAQLSGPEAA